MQQPLCPRPRAASNWSRTTRLLGVFGLQAIACHESDPARLPAQRDASVQPETVADAATDAELAPDAATSRADLPELCARPRSDAVRDIFCGEAAPTIRGLRELQAALQLSSLPLSSDEATLEALELEPSATIDGALFLGLSTALSGRLVSPINPRAILLGNETFMAFQRGVQQVELAAFDHGHGSNGGRLNFYLLTFRQSCNLAASGCLPGDLYTPSIERDWSSIALRDDEDLKNTVDDCRQCHQRGRDEPVLLMRELQAPWTHFFGLGQELAAYPGQQAQTTLVDLADDYQTAKGSESYAGLPAAFMRHTSGVFLQNRVPAGQPVEFDTSTIDSELFSSTSLPRRSASWDLSYQAFQRGEQLAPPHFESRPTDPMKQARLSAAYARYRAQEIAASELPELSDIFPDEPGVRAEIGLQVEPDASPAEALVQACGTCHNDVLDQSISRARFSIALSRMTRAELDLAIERIEQPAGQPRVMPPAASRQLDDAGRARLVAYLRSNQRSAEEDALLTAAARAGMAVDRAEYPQY